jgi:hypothetical protein
MAVCVFCLKKHDTPFALCPECNNRKLPSTK